MLSQSEEIFLTRQYSQEQLHAGCIFYRSTDESPMASHVGYTPYRVSRITVCALYLPNLILRIILHNVRR